jgi:hypothetical protein
MLGRHLTRGIAWVLLGMGLARPSGAVDTILVHGHVFTGKGHLGGGNRGQRRSHRGRGILNCMGSCAIADN